MKKCTLLLLIAALLTSTFVSCAGENEPETTADTTQTTVEDLDTDAGWQYPNVDYAGGEYRMLNYDKLWDMYIHMDAEELTGEPLNDAMYNRNRAIEEKLNCKIIEKEIESDASGTLTILTDAAKTSIISGSDDYDVMFIPANSTSFVVEGYMLDLMAIPELHLHEDWWDSVAVEAMTLRNKLYFAMGDINLMAYDSMWCLFFNETMMENHGMDKPYDLVREGAWTLDKLAEYCSAIANLNEDDSFKWNKNGTCVWGISSHQSSAGQFWFAAGVRCAEIQSDGTVEFVLDNENVFNVMDKLAVVLNGKNGNTLRASNTDFDADGGGYMYVFNTGRSLFLTAEIKGAQLLRDMDDNFGIVPMPKYDENQAGYSTKSTDSVFGMCIPTTNTKLSQTATISEVICHDSHEKIIPLYYETVVEHKGLRNEDSIEMLDIMRQGRSVDVATMFAWYTSDIRNSIYTKLFAGDNQVASIIAANKPAIEQNIADFLAYLEK